MPLITIPALAAEGMTAAQMAAAAAAAAEASTAAAAATAATTAATTAAPTLAATTTTALPGVMGGTGALGGAGSAGSVLSGAGGASTGASTLGGVTGATGAETLAAASPEIAGNLAAAGNTGIMSGVPGAAGASGAVPGATGAEAMTAGTGEGIMTDAGAMQPSGALNMGEAVASNPAGEAQIQQLMQNGTPPFANNPIGDPNVARAISNPLPASGMPPVQTAPIATPTSPPGMPGNPYPEMPGIDVPYDPQLPGIDVPYQSSTGNALERGIKSAVDFAKNNPSTMMAGSALTSYLTRPEPPGKKQYAKRDLSGFQRSEPSTSTYTPVYTPTTYAASGGLMGYAVGGPVERMAAMNAVGANTGYPQANLQTPLYSNPAIQRPQSTNVIAPSADAGVDSYTGEPRFAEGGDVPAVDKLEARNRKMLGIKTPQEVEEDFERGQDVMRREGFGVVTDADVDTRRKSPAEASMTQLKKIGKRIGMPVSDMPKSAVIDTDVFHAARGGITYGLGGYSDGGRLLKGPGDGVSDSIPASIGGRQPARLADGEFVVPARIVSELGNGSTEAGARKLYAMMERVQNARKKSIGKKKVAVNSKADKHLPA